MNKISLDELSDDERQLVRKFFDQVLGVKYVTREPDEYQVYVDSLRVKFDWNVIHNDYAHPIRKPDQAAMLFERGASVNEICALMGGIQTQTVEFYLRKTSKISHTGKKRLVPRRTGFDWKRVLPYGEAGDQIRWEFHQLVLRASKHGASYHQIANKIGVTEQRVRQIIRKAERWQRCPVENYLNPAGRVLPEVASLGRKVKNLYLKMTGIEKLEREELARLKAKYEN